jgi:hypothetical protein
MSEYPQNVTTSVKQNRSPVHVLPSTKLPKISANEETDDIVQSSSDSDTGYLLGVESSFNPHEAQSVLPLMDETEMS